MLERVQRVQQVLLEPRKWLPAAGLVRWECLHLNLRSHRHQRAHDPGRKGRWMRRLCSSAEYREAFPADIQGWAVLWTVFRGVELQLAECHNQRSCRHQCLQAAFREQSGRHNPGGT